jgi:hypothetical protein
MSDSLATGFVGKCTQCGSYDTRMRTEVINYGSDKPPIGQTSPIVSRTRIYVCNSCQHAWSETVKK